MLLFIYVILATETIFTECLLTPWLRIIFLKFTKNLMETKANFLSFLVTFGRSPIAIYATCLAPVYSKFNAESNPYIRFVYTWRESNKTRAFNINGKIFLKWRIHPFPMVNGLERYFENTGTQYVCWNVK